MKQLTCEMCGSNDLLKKDGVFECQTCGTKYSVEEAKKMMVEGVVEVQGTVSIDNTQKIDALIKRAKMMLEDDKYARSNALKLIDEAIQIDPENGELYWQHFLICYEDFSWLYCRNNKYFERALKYGDINVKTAIGKRINQWLPTAMYARNGEILPLSELEMLAIYLKEIEACDDIASFVENKLIDEISKKLNECIAKKHRLDYLPNKILHDNANNVVELTQTGIMYRSFATGFCTIDYDYIKSIEWKKNPFIGYFLCFILKDGTRTTQIPLAYNNPFKSGQIKVKVLDEIVNRLTLFNGTQFTNVLYI